MISPLPSGSAIKAQPVNGGYGLTWENRGLSGMARFGPAAFLIFWLCGWTVGETFAIGALIKGGAPGLVKLFLIGWLGAWTIGGYAAFSEVRRLLSKPRPDQLLLERSQLVWKPGTLAPNSTGTGATPSAKAWKTWRQARKQSDVIVPRHQATNIKLERVDACQRLTFDSGADRFEIGQSLREPEGEWLHELLTSWKQSPG